MTKEECIDRVELTQWSGDLSEEELFRRLFDIAMEYKQSTEDSSLDDIFYDYFFEPDAITYIEKEWKMGGIGRICVVVHDIHKLDATVFVRGKYGNLREYDYKDTQYIRSEIIRRLKGVSDENE